VLSFEIPKEKKSWMQNLNLRKKATTIWNSEFAFQNFYS